MAGETKKSVSGWTTDTLHAQMLMLAAEQEKRDNQRFEDIQVAIKAALAAAEKGLVGVDKQVEQRVAAVERGYQSAVSDADRRYEQRFAASQTAMTAAFAAAEKAVDKALAAQEKAVETALTAAEKAVDVRAVSSEREFHEHLEQVRHETSTAFLASDRAITKAELANEKRFDGVNEFREQLRAQATTFIARSEALLLSDRNTERINEMARLLATYASRADVEAQSTRNSDRIAELTDRINRNEGRGAGLHTGWGYLLGAVAALGTIMAIYLAVRGG